MNKKLICPNKYCLEYVINRNDWHPKRKVTFTILTFLSLRNGLFVHISEQ